MWYNDGMLETISQGELNLLEYLGKHSCGLGERISLDPKPITRGLRISETQFAADSAALVAHGLAGVRGFRPNSNDVPSSKCSAIWLTGKGEDYLRLASELARRARASETCA